MCENVIYAECKIVPRPSHFIIFIHTFLSFPTSFPLKSQKLNSDLYVTVAYVAMDTHCGTQVGHLPHLQYNVKVHIE